MTRATRVVSFGTLPGTRRPKLLLLLFEALFLCSGPANNAPMRSLLCSCQWAIKSSVIFEIGSKHAKFQTKNYLRTSLVGRLVHVSSAGVGGPGWIRWRRRDSKRCCRIVVLYWIVWFVFLFIPDRYGCCFGMNIRLFCDRVAWLLAWTSLPEYSHRDVTQERAADELGPFECQIRQNLRLCQTGVCKNM